MGSLRRCIALIVIVVLLSDVASAQQRSVPQAKQRARRPRRPTKGRTRAAADNGGPDGKVFNFKADGGAAAFLSKMDPAKLDKIMRNAGKSFDSLSQQLDQEPDLVSQCYKVCCTARTFRRTQAASRTVRAVLRPGLGDFMPHPYLPQPLQHTNSCAVRCIAYDTLLSGS
jgi:hypothetical protein